MEGSGKSLVDERERRTAEEEITSPLFVEAGAGTGKTRLLVNRYLNILKSGKAGCAEIVAITFTEKAASEMKERLRREISRLLATEAPTASASRDAEGDPDFDEYERMSRALIELERAPISTIHSFASSILRDHPVEAGIDPAFTQLVEPEGTIFLEECWRGYLAETGERDGAYIQRYLGAGGSLGKLRDIAAAFYSARFERYIEPAGCEGEDGESAGARPETEEVSYGGPERLYEALRDYAARLKKMASEFCVNSGDNAHGEIEAFVERMDAAESLEGTDLEDMLLGVRLPSKSKGAVKNWDPKDKCNEYKEIAAEIESVHEEYRMLFMDRVVSGLTGWLEGFLDYVESRKKESGVMDFDDLLIKTRQLLDNGDVVRSLQRRYRYILVDEFQDTDSIQADIILILAGHKGQKREAEAGGEGSLFIVGDPKQSIYRFRKADIEVYERVKGRFRTDGSLLGISQNFRSGRGIVDWVNAVFSELIVKPDEGGYQPEYEPISAHREDGNAEVVLMDLETGQGKIKADDLRRSEGLACARLIKRLVKEKRKVRDVDTGDFRPVRFSDIAMIYRGGTGIQYYEEPLRNEGIPYIIEGGGLYYARQEIRDLAAALWAVEDPWDELSLFSTLRSSLFGISDEEIFLFRERGGRLNYLSANVPKNSGYEYFEEVFGLLADLHGRRNSKGSAWTVGELVKRTNFRETSYFRPHGRQRVANIRKAFQAARAFDGSGYSFRSFAEYFLERAAESQAARGLFGRSEPESSLIDEEENAVRLLSVHKSKGLQFPVVIMSNLLQSRRYRAGIYVREGASIEAKIGTGLRTSGYDNAVEMDKLREEAENLRLMYVAATRAGDLLVIPAVSKKNSFFEILAPYLPLDKISRPEEGAADSGYESAEITPGMEEARNLVSVVPVSQLPPLSASDAAGALTSGKGVKGKGADKRARDRWTAERQRLIEVSTRPPRILTPSGAEGATVSDLERSVEKERERTVPGGKDRAALFGSAFHRIMELADFSSTAGIKKLAAEASRGFGIPEAEEELAILAEKTLLSDVIRKAAAAEELLREVPFYLRLDGRQEGAYSKRAVYLNGRVDLLFRSGAYWTAVDFKTDDIKDPAERADIYRPQGLLYILALARSGVELEKGIYFLFARPGRTFLVEKECASEEDIRRLIFENSESS